MVLGGLLDDQGCEAVEHGDHSGGRRSECQDGMVLLTTFAMHSARQRPHSQHDPPTSSPSSSSTPSSTSSHTSLLHSSTGHLHNNHHNHNNHPLGYAHTSGGLSLSPRSGLGFAHTNGYFYSPSHGDDTPAKSIPRMRNNSGGGGGGSCQDVTSSSSSSVSAATMTSRKLYTSLTNLDEWSPATVSLSSLLRQSHVATVQRHHPHHHHHHHHHPQHRPVLQHSGSQDLSEDDGTGSHTTVESPSSDPCSLSYSSMPEKSASSGGGFHQDRALLRRTLSAEPHTRTEFSLVPSEGVGVVCDEDFSGGVVDSPDDPLEESEYVTLDYTYVPSTSSRASVVSAERDSLGSGSRHSEVSCGSSAHSAETSYRQYYSDENNYYHLNDCSSSGYTSNGSSSGKSSSQGSLPQPSAGLSSDRASRAKSMSMERLWSHSLSSRTVSPLERGRSSLPRKKSSQQTLQTVAEVLQVSPQQQRQQPHPTKSILKNSNSNSSSCSQQGGSGSTTPRSNTSGSCRSSITSRLDCGSVHSSELPFTEPLLCGGSSGSARSRLSASPLAGGEHSSGRNSRSARTRTRTISGPLSQEAARTRMSAVDPSHSLNLPFSLSMLTRHKHLSHALGGSPSGSSSSNTRTNSSAAAAAAKEGGDTQHPEHRLRLRSKSLSDLRQDDNDDDDDCHVVSGCYSDDEDGDDFGFLSHSHGSGGSGGSKPHCHDAKDNTNNTVASSPSSSSGSSSWLRTAMHKGKGVSGSGSSSPSHRLLPRRWRNKNKGSSSSSSSPRQTQAMWSPGGPCTWCSVSGRKVILKPVNLMLLSEAERLVLQKLAHSKLQSMDLGCPIVVPKDPNDLRSRKKRALSLKRRSKSANLSSLLDNLSSDKSKDKENKDGKPAGLVFGIPLSRCIANERELCKHRQRAAGGGGGGGVGGIAGGGKAAAAAASSSSTPSSPQPPSSSSSLPLQPRPESSDQLLLSPCRARKSSSSSQGSTDNGAHNGTVTSSAYDSARRAASSDSLSESDHSSRNTSSSLIEALSLQQAAAGGVAGGGGGGGEGGSRGGGGVWGSHPQVPHIVDACFRHLETHGLHVLGIFRVGSSKKRVKQLREEFDSGREVHLTGEHNSHDVGALLKEFFRDLPEPLLTRDLYMPFVATRKIKDREKQAEAVRLLLTLLPPANRDTLWALLRFLDTVHRHSDDTKDSSGKEVPGNKMDSHNLATLFGPNILHKARAVSEKQFMAECAEQAEQSSEVIAVIKDMIDNHFDLFQISDKQRDEVLKLMMEADHENLDRVLRRLSNENQIEPDPESMCSVFEAEVDPCPQSLPHTANSDADLLQLLLRRKGLPMVGGGGAGGGSLPHHPYQPSHSFSHHQPLRTSHSADPWTDPIQRANPTTSLPLSWRLGSVDNAAERLSHSPSPQDSPGYGYGSLPRPPVVTISSDSSEVVLRSSSTGRRRGGVEAAPRPLSAHVVGRERPFSESYVSPAAGSGGGGGGGSGGGLSIPKPAYVRENSGASSASCSSYLSSSGGHASDSGLWVMPTPPLSRSASPLAQRRAASGSGSGSGPRQGQSGRRRVDPVTGSSRSDDDDGACPAVGSPEWQRERWRHWQEITAGRNGGAGDAEQETLV